MLQEIKSAQTITELAAAVDKLTGDITEEITRAVQGTLYNLTEERLYTLKNDADKMIRDNNLSDTEKFIRSESSKLQDEIKTVITDDYTLLNRVNSRADEIINSCSESFKRMRDQIKSAQKISDLQEFGSAKNPELANLVGEMLAKFVDSQLEPLKNKIDSLITSRRFNEADSLIDEQAKTLKQEIISVRSEGALIGKVNDVTESLAKKVKDSRPGFARAFFTFILVVIIIAGGVFAYDNYYNDGKILEQCKTLVLELSNKLNQK